MPRRILQTNGSLGATIKSPLGWDVKKMFADGHLPGVRRATCTVRRTEEVPGFAEFAARILGQGAA